MRRYRLAVFLVILLVWTLPVQPSASSPAHAATEALDGKTGPLHLETTKESGVTAHDDSEMVLDAVGTGTGLGLATDARYHYGDSDAPVERPAFTLTNTASNAHDLTLAYTGATDDNPAANVQFLLHDATGKQVAVVTEEHNTTTIYGLPSGETIYVTVLVDTHGLSKNDDLSGTLRLYA